MSGADQRTVNGRWPGARNAVRTMCDFRRNGHYRRYLDSCWARVQVWVPQVEGVLEGVCWLLADYGGSLSVLLGAAGLPAS